MQRTCIHCGATFEPRSHRDKLCSDTCRAKRQHQHSMAWAKRHPERMQAAQHRIRQTQEYKQKKNQYYKDRRQRIKNAAALIIAYTLHRADQHPLS